MGEAEEEDEGEEEDEAGEWRAEGGVSNRGFLEGDVPGEDREVIPEEWW